MTKYTKHDPGTFCWIELHTSDGAAAKRFYCDLFGWTPNEIPMGEGQPPYISALYIVTPTGSVQPLVFGPKPITPDMAPPASSTANASPVP